MGRSNKKRRPPTTAPCNPALFAKYNSYGEPAFATRGYYEDTPFRCVDCGKDEVWTATQQKWWFELAKGEIFTKASRCRACRRKERIRREEARRIHLEGIAKKKKSER